MQIPSIPFFQTTDQSTNGYQNYLKNVESNRWMVFDPTFLFTQIFYLMYYKMYRELFSYMIVLGTLLGYMGKFPTTVLSIIAFAMISLSFFSHKLYQMSNERLLHKIENNFELFLVKKQYPQIVLLSYVRMFLILMVSVYVFTFFLLISIYCNYSNEFLSLLHK